MLYPFFDDIESPADDALPAAVRLGLLLVTPQDLGGVRYAFVSWSDGGASSHEVVASASASYTATFQATSADVGIAQVAQVGAGTVRLDLTVTNNGPIGATGVTARTTLSSKLTFVSATSTVGTCAYQSSTRVVTCTIGSLAASGQALVTTADREPLWALGSEFSRLEVRDAHVLARR